MAWPALAAVLVGCIAVAALAAFASAGSNVCLLVRIPNEANGGGCAPIQSAVSPATPLMSQRAYPPSEPEQGATERSGDALFANGTSDVTLTSPSGAVRTLPIVNNTVAFIGGADETLSWAATDGHRYSSHFMH
jgi:hypothetical protein